jgi:hypothetical protein
MVFKDETELIKAIKEVEKTPQWVEDAREYHKKMKALVYGDDFKELLLKIEHIESEKRAKARKKYTRPIKDINNKLLEPVGNVYSATGGGFELKDLTDKQKADLLGELKDVRGGYSLRKWLETYWSKDLYNVDPSGLMFLEWKDEKAYPTYKSIDCIRDYVPNGLSCEYVIFEPKDIPNKDDKIWRVVDDEKDYKVIQKGEAFSISQEKTIKHDFGKCPARINSDVHKFGKEYRLAPIDTVIETEEELLRDRGILTMYKFLNGFSTPYKPVVVCPECRGTKKNGTEVCKSCDGKGHVLTKDVTDEILLPIDLNSDKQIPLPTNFAGFISPDLEIWNQYRQELKDLFNLEIFEPIWGTRETEVKDQTAQAAILNTQPMITRLNKWSDVAESQESFFTELLANFHTDKDKNKRVAVITYGRNYIIQPPEYLLDQYQKSKESKDPITILDRKLIEYLTSKYKNDPDTLHKELLKKQLEPYVHYDIELVKDIYGQKEAQKKGLFTDWWESLNDYSADVSKLETDMNKWIEDKINNLNLDNNGNSSSEEI